MSLQFTRQGAFVECPSCAAKPGSPQLCRECLERRELHGVVERFRETLPALAKEYGPGEETKQTAEEHAERGRQFYRGMSCACSVCEAANRWTRLLDMVSFCEHCPNGYPNPECPEHGR